MKRTPILRMIHDTNHTQTTRVGSLSSTHSSDTNMITQLTGYKAGVQYTNLNPGLYSIEISDNTYVFDLYRTISGSNYLQINNCNDAFFSIGLEYYSVILYKHSNTHEDSDSYIITSTVNDAMDLLVINGYTKLTTISGNTIPSLDKPMGIQSVSTLSFTSTAVLTEDSEDININLKTYIKSLPNGVKDSCIINSELQKYHIVGRVGRLIFSGYESWEELEDYCTDDYCVYFCANSNVAIQDDANNINCTHLPVVKGSSLLSTSTSGNYIATCHDNSIGNGFLMKVSVDLFEYTSNDEHLYYFQKWLNGIMLSGNPMIIEYPLATENYKSILLDEYHVSTYYNSTMLSLSTSGDCNLSYFYKSL